VRKALPEATVVVDCFHIVQLAQRHLADLRRRLTWKQHGRRARKGDAIYTVRRLLRRNEEDLSPAQLTFLETELTQMGTYGRQIHEAWRAKELLRDLLRLTAKHAHILPDHSAISAARYRFQRFCADRTHLPELITLAETVDQWWDGIEAYVITGITNAASEPARPATTPPSASSATASSASSTAASKPAPTTTKRPPGRSTHTPIPLDLKRHGVSDTPTRRSKAVHKNLHVTGHGWGFRHPQAQ
ncbi:transposase, partial [Actinacidiphila oryziradicis]